MTTSPTDSDLAVPTTSACASPAEAGQASAAGILTIDLAVLVDNWRRLGARAGSAECAAVVKADGYGTGLEPAVKALSAAGCRTFFVAHLSEAERARKVAPSATIYVLNGLLPGTAERFAALGARPVLGSREEVDEWVSFGRTAGSPLPAALHVDTGMNRLGLRVEEALALAADPAWRKAFTPALVMSHFVAAEEPGHPLTARQIEAFAAVRAAFAGVPASLANSSGICLADKPHYDLVRPGYALYGGNPTPETANPMRPVVGLEVPIIQLRTVEDGESVGYNARWTARERRRIASIFLGYADGIPRAIGGSDERPGGEVIVAGRRCPIVGNVSMDLITIDVTDVPETEVRRGDPVTVLGADLGVDAVGTAARTIGYEILTSLGRRYQRRYRE